jgi:HD-GYP domain-containing protein (c-di-GMP phosphodiesterase class II)
MAINYKKELEDASKTMILVHDPEKLIKRIVRMIIQKVKVSHANILLRDEKKETYLITVSRGVKGLKVPVGFTRLDNDNPLIRIFNERTLNGNTKASLVSSTGTILYAHAKNTLAILSNEEFRSLLSNALYQMEIFETVACVPSYFHDELIGLLLLGRKNDDSEFTGEELNFFSALASDVAMAIHNAQMFSELEKEVAKNKQLFMNMTEALAQAIDAKDHYTHGHTNRVKEVSLAIAKRWFHKHTIPIDENFLRDIHIASTLHDIGKIGVPEAILNKQGPLTPEEFNVIKQHPSIGEKILQSIVGLDNCISAVKYHHERFDGMGYPEGLKGEQIPLIAAIICVADAYDAMVSDRPYRKGLSKEKAISEITTMAGKQFHPEISLIMEELYKEGKV